MFSGGEQDHYIQNTSKGTDFDFAPQVWGLGAACEATGVVYFSNKSAYHRFCFDALWSNNSIDEGAAAEGI